VSGLSGFWRLFSLLDQEYDQDDETLRSRIDKAKTYVDNNTHRADIVNPLPSSAPPGYLLVTPGDTNLYVGAGMANPLRKIPTQAV
jgi:hypothetical protein